MNEKRQENWVLTGANRENRAEWRISVFSVISCYFVLQHFETRKEIGRLVIQISLLDTYANILICENLLICGFLRPSVRPSVIFCRQLLSRIAVFLLAN